MGQATSDLDDAAAALAAAQTMMMRSRSSSISSSVGGLGASGDAAGGDPKFGDYSYKNLPQLREANKYGIPPRPVHPHRVRS